MKTRTIIKNQNGATAVEFALILPLLILILFGIIEFGLLLYNQQVITNAAREGARAGVIVRYPDRLSNDDIKDEVIKYGKAHLITFGSGTLEPNITILPINNSSFDPTVDPPVDRCTHFGCHLIVEVNYYYDFLVLSRLFGQKHLRAVSVMRME